MFDELNEIERRVLRRLSQGALNKNIAKELGMSMRSVENYRQRIMRKMGAQSPCNLGYLFAVYDLRAGAYATDAAGVEETTEPNGRERRRAIPAIRMPATYGLNDSPALTVHQGDAV